MKKYLMTIVAAGSSLCIVSSPVQSEIIPAVCPPVLKMTDSDPAHLSTGIPVDTTITLTWDKETLQKLSDNIRDLKPVLESVNIAGGRYGMGTLLTTEWGVGGSVRWEDNLEVIVPEAVLEPGTQYRVWTYLYMTIRNKETEHCPGIGGEMIFTTAGPPPEDMKPIRGFDLSTLYYGDKFGRTTLRGPITELNLPLRVVSIKDENKGLLKVVIYEGTPILRQGGFAPLESLRIGDQAEVTFTGGRVSTVILLDVE